MLKIRLLPLLFLACIAYSQPSGVTWFVNNLLPPPRKYRLVTMHDQYQIFYEYQDADDLVPIPASCPNTFQCYNWPKECE